MGHRVLPYTAFSENFFSFFLSGNYILSDIEMDHVLGSLAVFFFVFFKNENGHLKKQDWRVSVCV